MSQNQTQLVSVPFNGEIVVAAVIDGKPYVPMKPICNNLGLDWDGQRQRIKRNEVMAKGAVVITVPSNGGEQEMLCLPLSMLNGWLFGVDVNRVKEGLRDKLIKYQTECFDVLAQHFMPAVAQAMRPEPQPAPTNSREKLNASDMQHIKRVVWFAARNFHRQEAVTQGIWYHLREVTYNPAPNAYSVDHIPVLAAELRRIVGLCEQVSQITRHVEEQAVKRIFRKGETAEKVLAYLARQAASDVQKLREGMAEFPTWMEADLIGFAERQPARFINHYEPEQPDFFLSAA